jgi:hypothetical protein
MPVSDLGNKPKEVVVQAVSQQGFATLGGWSRI